MAFTNAIPLFSFRMLSGLAKNNKMFFVHTESNHGNVLPEYKATSAVFPSLQNRVEPQDSVATSLIPTSSKTLQLLLLKSDFLLN